MTDSIDALGGAVLPRGTEQADKRTALDRDAFMKLLVAQLENQDPLDPMDQREMITQLSQLTSVEHLIGIEDKIGALQASTVGLANAEVASLLGKQVEIDGSRMTLDTHGSAEASYVLPPGVNSVTVTIRDASGKVVQVLEQGPRASGTHTLSWDGIDSERQRVAAGTYRISVAASDASGSPLDAHTNVRGVVDGVTYERGVPELLVGPVRALLGDVLSVSSPQGPSATSTPSTGGRSPVTE